MSEAFNWNRILKSDVDPTKAAEKEGLAINPVTGEPILDKKAPLEVVPGGATEESAATEEVTAEAVAAELQVEATSAEVEELGEALTEATLEEPSAEESSEAKATEPAKEAKDEPESKSGRKSPPIVDFSVDIFADEFPTPEPAAKSAPAEFPPDFKFDISEEVKADLSGFNDPDDEADAEAKRLHYQPAALPDNIYEIQLPNNKFDVGAEIQALSDAIDIGEDVTPIEDVHLDDILRCAIERKASDIHLTVGLPPMARIDGEVAPLPYSVAQAADTRRLIYDTLSDEHVQKVEQTHELDFGYGVSGLGRFRFNVYMQRGSYAAALRAIPTKIPSFEQLGLPNVIRDISKRSSGLVLVTGPTGSGKSTTIASMIDDINDQRTSHIITIEDPIEYLHPHKKCMVNQRELHGDTYSFHNALRAVLREDPDIILVGELRDLETIEAALTLAETGHLVFGTLHTRNAPSTIDRVIDVFPSDQQDQIRVLLGNTLEGVVSQQLLPRLGGGRCAAIEIMIGTPAIKNLIREGKTHQMYSVIETSSNIGMQTMDSSLSNLFRQGYASYDECLMRAVDKETFARLAKGG